MIRTTIRLAALTALATVVAASWTAQASVAQDSGAGLQASEWRLVTIGSVAITASEPVIRLGSNGDVGGSTGCNMVKATYRTDGSSLSFGPIGTTRKFCRAVWETERAFLAMLADVRGYMVKDGSLVLTGGNGETLAEFRAD